MTSEKSSIFTTENIEALIKTYRDGLLKDTVPFWLKNSMDREMGGFITCLSRDGSVHDTDKGLWQQGRSAWILATLYNTVEKKQEWLDAAKHGIDFILKHGIDADGRMFFLVTRDGKPLRKRRYVYTEAFAAMALAAYAKASGDKSAGEKALELYTLMLEYLTTPGKIEPKGYPQTRSMKTMGTPMIIMLVSQTIRENIGDPRCDGWIDWALKEIKDFFIRDDLKVVLENVGEDGQILDHYDGRILHPPHVMEVAWFILKEARHRGNDPDLVATACKMIDYMWENGWDKEYGGIIYFTDVKGLPIQEYWADMKFWWCQNEAIISTLFAWFMTGDEKYARMHQQIHDWTYQLFPDREHGDWFGYFHRDGRLSTDLKGNYWKGLYHVPRMQWMCWQLLEEAKKR